MMKRIISLILIFSMLLTGCMASIPEADPKAEINFYMNIAPTNLDPQTTFYTYDVETLSTYCEGLVNKDKDSNIIPGIAERWEVSDDGLKYRFYLRKDAKWSNGTPVTADDFVFGWQRVLDPNTASDASFLFLNGVNMKGAEEVFYENAPLDTLGVKAVSSHILEVELNEPCPYFLQLVCSACCLPCNMEFYYAHKADYGKRGQSIISCGPYTVDYYEPMGMQIHLTKNKYYYDADKVSVPGINIQIIEDVQQLIMSFEKGDADIIPLSGEQQEVSEGDPRMTYAPKQMFYYIQPNMNNPILTNRNIRIAMNLSINREKIQENLLKAGYYPHSRIIPDGFCKDPDGSDFAEDPNKYSDICGFDREKARQYWEKGLKELNISSAVLEYITTSDNNTFMDVLKEEWENTLPGFTMKYRVVPAKAYYEEIKKGKFDLLYYGFGADYADPSTYLNVLSEDSELNYGNYDSSDYNRALKESKDKDIVNDPEKRFEKLHEAEDIIMNDAGIFPMYSYGPSRLVSSDVKGIEFRSIYPAITFKNAVKEVH